MKYTFDDFPPGLAVVSGAAQGIGAAVAQQLAQAGLTVAALDCQEEGLQALVQTPAARSGRILPCVLDVSQPDPVRAAVTRLEAACGPIGTLALVAGVLRPGSACEVSLADWDSSFAVNALGVVHLAQAVVPGMMARRSGSVVLVGSNAATVPRHGMAAYCASKAAAQHYMRCLALEAAPSGVRCNIVAPGSTDTAMLGQLNPQDSQRRAIAGDPAHYRLGIPLQRVATPQDIANAVVFMLSSASRHITLHTLCIDGGATLDS